MESLRIKDVSDMIGRKVWFLMYEETYQILRVKNGRINQVVITDKHIFVDVHVIIDKKNYKVLGEHISFEEIKLDEFFDFSKIQKDIKFQYTY